MATRAFGQFKSELLMPRPVLHQVRTLGHASELRILLTAPSSEPMSAEAAIFGPSLYPAAC
jgi:hypothetical protein